MTTQIFQMNKNNEYEINFVFVSEEAERLHSEIEGEYIEALGDEFSEDDLPQWATFQELEKRVEEELKNILYPEPKSKPRPIKRIRRRREEIAKNLPMLYKKEEI